MYLSLEDRLPSPTRWSNPGQEQPDGKVAHTPGVFPSSEQQYLKYRLASYQCMHHVCHMYERAYTAINSPFWEPCLYRYTTLDGNVKSIRYSYYHIHTCYIFVLVAVAMNIIQMTRCVVS